MRVTFYAYCGMSIPIDAGLDEEDARTLAARVLRRRRATGHPVSKLKPADSDEMGRWEAGEPEDCALVPDTAGILVLEKEPSDPMPCGHAGTSYDRRELGCRECDAADMEAADMEAADEDDD